MPMKGNKFGTKLKDPELRQKAYASYCKHLESGRPKQSFHFDYEHYHVCYKTIERYMKENPEEFPAFLMEKALAKRYQHWFDKGIALMEGKMRFGCPTIWQTIMRNMFRDIGWDKQDDRTREIDMLEWQRFKDFMLGPAPPSLGNERFIEVDGD